MERLLYFAYGSNILEDEMEELKKSRCQGGGYFKYVGKAFLKDYEFGFDIRGDGGKATVRPKEGEIAQGVLHLIDSDLLKCLDAKEDHPNTYRRCELFVESNSKNVLAWVYISNKGFGGKADQDYLINKIIKGAEQRGLDTEVYKKFIEQA